MEPISPHEIENLRTRISQESNPVEIVKMQKELSDKEKEFYSQHEARLKEIEETPWIFGSKEAQ
jgi:hypothetical protein